MAKVMFLAKTFEAVQVLRQPDCDLPRDARTLLVLVDGSRHLKQLRMMSAFNGVRDFDAALAVLNERGLLQELPEASGDEISIESPNEKVAEVNLLSLDFAIPEDAFATPLRPATAVPTKAAAPAKPTVAAANTAPAPVKPVPTPAVSAPLSMPKAAADSTVSSPHAAELRARLEREIRDRLVSELTPKVTEELRKSLVPEVRAQLTKAIYEKLVAGLRPLIEVRLRQQLEPQIKASIEREYRAKGTTASADSAEPCATPKAEAAVPHPVMTPPEPAAQANTEATVH